MIGLLHAFRDLSLFLGDFLWKIPLGISPDFALALLALFVSALVCWLRLVSMPSEMRRRVRDDLKRLRSLRTDAKQRSDVDALTRLDRTELQIRLRLLGAELRTAVWLVLPLAATTLWCDARLEYQPIVKHELVPLTAYFPLTSIDRPAHLVPSEGLDCESGWITRVEIDPNDRTRARAQWFLRPVSDRSHGERRLALRHAGETMEVAIRWGDAFYAPPSQSSTASTIQGVHIALRTFRFLGLLPWPFAMLLVALLVGQVESLVSSKRHSVNRSAAKERPPVHRAVEPVPARDES